MIAITFADSIKCLAKMVKLYITKGKGFRIESGHPWVYNNEIQKMDGNPEPAEIVEVYNFKDEFIGRGYYNEKSQICCRILTRDFNEEIDKDFFKRRISAAYEYRKQVGYTDNYRLVFGEADQLSGLVIDKFSNVYVLQILTLGMERWKNDIVEIIEELFSPEGIYERNDVPVRVLEGLTEQKNFLSKPFSTKQVINECGVKFQIDIEQGQKTGFFLDQKENRMELEHIVKGASVLDCFTYTGSFAMNAAFYGAKEVIGYDISEWAIEQAKQNAALNKFNQCHFECVNAFDKLPELVKAKKQFDIVVLDPPAITKNRSGIQSALRGYKEINLRGMRLTKPGGFLITFSCSHYMTPDYFFSTLHEAAYDAGKTIRQVKYLQQAKDHPVMWNVPETNYLKGYVLQVI